MASPGRVTRSSTRNAWAAISACMSARSMAASRWSGSTTASPMWSGPTIPATRPTVRKPPDRPAAAGHMPPPRHARRAGTWMAGTRPVLSGLDFRRGLCAHERQHLRSSIVTPDLFRGPGKPGESGACGPGPRNKSGVTIGGRMTAAAGMPRSVSRSDRCADIPPLPRPCTPSNSPEPDSNGTSPGMTGGETRRRMAGNSGTGTRAPTASWPDSFRPSMRPTKRLRANCATSGLTARALRRAAW